MKQFNKSDLKDGMILEDRDGERYIYLKNKLLGGMFGHSSLIDFDNELINIRDDGATIIKVYQMKSCSHSLKYIFNDENLELVWQRPEPLLTDDEKRFIKNCAEVVNNINHIDYENMRVFRGDWTIHITNNTDSHTILGFDYSDNFSNLEKFKDYTLKELGL